MNDTLSLAHRVRGAVHLLLVSVQVRMSCGMEDITCSRVGHVLRCVCSLQAPWWHQTVDGETQRTVL